MSTIRPEDLDEKWREQFESPLTDEGVRALHEELAKMPRPPILILEVQEDGTYKILGWRQP